MNGIPTCFSRAVPCQPCHSTVARRDRCRFYPSPFFQRVDVDIVTSFETRYSYLGGGGYPITFLMGFFSVPLYKFWCNTLPDSYHFVTLLVNRASALSLERLPGCCVFPSVGKCDNSPPSMLLAEGVDLLRNSVRFLCVTLVLYKGPATLRISASVLHATRGKTVVGCSRCGYRLQVLSGETHV